MRLLTRRLTRRLNGNFDLLREIIGEGQQDVLRIQRSFPLKRLTDRANFLSLLHYFGLLSIREVVDGAPPLAIPNCTRRSRGVVQFARSLTDRLTMPLGVDNLADSRYAIRDGPRI